MGLDALAGSRTPETTAAVADTPAGIGCGTKETTTTGASWPSLSAASPPLAGSDSSRVAGVNDKVREPPAGTGVGAADGGGVCALVTDVDADGGDGGGGGDGSGSCGVVDAL
mmetsp:Transcript_14326/g.44507  ORF Transcript_14326/g.44507 Transcript_14326/m.44507 type:complete len:112 (+) Transcript_14326:1145-1480(+)